MAAPSHVVILFCATAGQNGENLGSDEEQIVLFVYLLYDVINNKVNSLQCHHVRPVTDDISETLLTEECKIQTGLSEEAIKHAQPLEQVLEEFERFVRSKEVHPDHGGKSFCFITDGPLHLRLCMHPEACKKNIHLPDHYYRYFDLRRDFKKFYKADVINCIKDMLEFIGIEEDNSVEYGVRHCQEMASIIHRLINDGHVFRQPDVVNNRLEPGICNKNDVVDDDTVIRARGLPWQSSDQDIAKFFQGLNVAKGGVALCLSQQGRRNGEALVRFENKENRDLALRKHKHHLGQRYIEVYRATGKDFVNVAGGNSSEAQAFLSRHSELGGQVIVRMRGLPYSATSEQVLMFFRSGDNPCEVLDGENGLLFVHQADGRATGDAFVLFSNEDDANKALSKHRQCISTRYIELFKSTTAEVQQVLNRSLDPRTPSELPDPHMSPLISHLPTSPLPGVILPQQLITSGTQRDCIRLRGLPFEASVTDILTFLGEHSRNIVFQGVHMVYNAQGTPSGEAFIQMDSELAAETGALLKHKKFMFIGNKKRYIEVLQCSGEDMNLILTNGVTSPVVTNMLPPTVAAAQTVAAPMMQRQILSPANSLMPPTSVGMHPCIYPYPQLQQHALLAQANAAAVGMPSPITHLSPRPSPYGSYHQPILYWYPSPPVSPQSAYYVHACPTTVVVKGLPFTVQIAEILALFEGIYEMPPDIQLQRGIDGRPNGEAFVTFGSRVEAERAITERNRKVVGNRFVELHMA
ncbi:hypothetical protein NP493_65g02011 [Ridgeia piscesae]|uniref:RRM domain-containing protein n=1 Tax=Ridgeia piscesae TaxID=27915 RepID=A0AAD9P9W0_RIDPI|nr:hypothetical protein NP493_65g02011 [Ridgeia piscesae]